MPSKVNPYQVNLQKFKEVLGDAVDGQQAKLKEYLESLHKVIGAIKTNLEDIDKKRQQFIQQNDLKSQHGQDQLEKLMQAQQDMQVRLQELQEVYKSLTESLVARNKNIAELSKPDANRSFQSETEENASAFTDNAIVTSNIKSIGEYTDEGKTTQKLFEELDAKMDEVGQRLTADANKATALVWYNSKQAGEETVGLDDGNARKVDSFEVEGLTSHYAGNEYTVGKNFVHYSRSEEKAEKAGDQIPKDETNLVVEMVKQYRANGNSHFRVTGTDPKMQALMYVVIKAFDPSVEPVMSVEFDENATYKFTDTTNNNLSGFEPATGAGGQNLGDLITNVREKLIARGDIVDVAAMTEQMHYDVDAVVSKVCGR